MIRYILIATCFVACSQAEAQTYSEAKDSLGNTKSNSGGIAFNRFGVCTIKLKDGTRLINCALKAIKPLSIDYVKNRVMHHLSIEKIKCIIPDDKSVVIWFDEKNKVVSGTICP